MALNDTAIGLLRSLARAHLAQAAVLKRAAHARTPTELLRCLADVDAAERRVRAIRARLRHTPTHESNANHRDFAGERCGGSR